MLKRMFVATILMFICSIGFAQLSSVSKSFSNTGYFRLIDRNTGNQTYHGTGVIFSQEMKVSKDSNKTEKLSFLITCFHTIKMAKKIVKVNTPFGEVDSVEYDNSEFVQYIYDDNGKKTGEKTYVTKPIYCDQKNDLAVLLIEGYQDTTENSDMLGTDFNVLGSDLYTVSCHSDICYMLILGKQSCSSIFFDSPAEIIGMEFDQINCIVHPGSSGAGIFDEDGNYVGMVSRAWRNCTLIIPARNIKKSLYNSKLDWIYNKYSNNMPFSENIKNKPAIAY